MIKINGKALATPHMVMSVSSVHTSLSPEEYTEILAARGTQTILVSAYDLYHSNCRYEFVAAIKAVRAKGGIIFMDSGNYEKSRNLDKCWTQSKFAEIASEIEADLYFCFDNHMPPSSAEDVATDVIERVKRDQKTTERGRRIQPIIHPPKVSTRISHSDSQKDFIDACFYVAEELRPEVLTVAERDLGHGIFERARTIQEIRNKLSSLKRYQPIHVLGAGNPLSVAILAAAGADLFDGLEWCRTSVDHETARLLHTHQYDFYSWQTEWAAENWDYVLKMLTHNLEFYHFWNVKLAQALENNELWEWLEKKNYLSASIVADARNNIGV